MISYYILFFTNLHHILSLYLWQVFLFVYFVLSEKKTQIDFIVKSEDVLVMLEHLELFYRESLSSTLNVYRTIYLLCNHFVNN